MCSNLRVGIRKVAHIFAECSAPFVFHIEKLLLFIFQRRLILQRCQHTAIFFAFCQRLFLLCSFCQQQNQNQQQDQCDGCRDQEREVLPFQNRCRLICTRTRVIERCRYDGYLIRPVCRIDPGCIADQLTQPGGVDRILCSLIDGYRNSLVLYCAGCQLTLVFYMI